MVLLEHSHPICLKWSGDFPGGLAIVILCFHCGGCRFDSWLGNLLHVWQKNNNNNNFLTGLQLLLHYISRDEEPFCKA